MSTDRRAYRVDVRTRETLYRQALESIPHKYLPRDDVQRSTTARSLREPLYYKQVETPLEDARARSVWYCSYVAAGSYAPDRSFEDTVLSDPYENLTDVRWIGMSSSGKVLATARTLKPDERGHFQIHNEKAGFGELALPPDTIYGPSLPNTPEQIAVTREVSAFALDIGARTWHRDALLGLIKTILNGFQEAGIIYAYSSIDESFFLLVNHMGLRLEQVGRKSYYMGGVTVPAFMVVEKMIENLLPDHPALHAFIAGGDEFPPGSRYSFYRRVRT